MRFILRLLIVLLLTLWLLGVFIEWLIPVFPNIAVAVPFLQKSYSLVCHQQQQKLLGESVYHSLVCSRCAGIYLGFYLVSIVSLFYAIKKEPKLKILLIAAIPMIADVILYSLGFYDYSKTLALLTGVLLGSIGFLYFYSALKKLIQELSLKKN
ncbi:MAG: DUF2085 domain-containing protein [Ignavibacteriales bacterium]|nr:DUF2085 domain-containing protein [Ignavibacteriales bacterium]